MRKAILLGATVFVVALAGIVVFGPARTNPPSNPADNIDVVAHAPPAVTAILDRSCRDCHSNETRWPWYSRVPPLSIGVINHVNDGRRHMNFSRWGTYDPEDASEFLVDMCALARKHDMPLPSYTWIHRDAPLSDQDVAVLCAWTESERRREY